MFDPTWIREELNLEAEFEPLVGRPQPAHASNVGPMPALVAAARVVAERIRRERLVDTQSLICRSDLDHDLTVRALAVQHVDRLTREELFGWIEELCNFQLHWRRVFQVHESTSWMLGATDLDLNGEDLRLPFVSFAVVFTDRYALGLAERALSHEPSARLRGRILRSVTAYVSQTSRGEDRQVRIALGCDALDGQFPSLLARELIVRPEAKLDEILDSHVPGELSVVDATADGLVRRLVRLVFNVILYANSTRPSSDANGDPLVEILDSHDDPTSDRVDVLRTAIDIGSVMQLKRFRRARGKRRTIMQRTLVRGHWRRPHAIWKDLRPRWIAPHWRGPADGAIVDKTYRLEP